MRSQQHCTDKDLILRLRRERDLTDPYEVGTLISVVAETLARVLERNKQTNG